PCSSSPCSVINPVSTAIEPGPERAGRLPRIPELALPQRLRAPMSASLAAVSGTLQIRLFGAPPVPVPAPAPAPPPAEPLTGMPPGVVTPGPADSPLLNQKPPALGSSGAPPPLPPTMFHVPEPSGAPVSDPPEDKLGVVPTDPVGPPAPEMDPELSLWFSQKPPAFGSGGVPPPLPPTMFQVLASPEPPEGSEPLTGLMFPSTAWPLPPA